MREKRREREKEREEESEKKRKKEEKETQNNKCFFSIYKCQIFMSPSLGIKIRI